MFSRGTSWYPIWPGVANDGPEDYGDDADYYEETRQVASKTFTGELTFLFKKKVDGRSGPITAYSGKITKPDGEEYEDWVSFGFKKPECEQGDHVEILTVKEKGFWQAKDVTITQKGDQGEDDPSEETPAKDSGSGKSGTRASHASSGRQASPSSSTGTKSTATSKQIHYQNSRTAALGLADLLLKHKAVPLTAAATKSGEAARFEEVTALVDKLTVKLYHDLETFRLVNDIEDAYEAPAAAEAGFDGEEGDDAGEGDDE